MPLSRRLRSAALILANALLPVAVLVFAIGFFPYKLVLPGLADWAEDDVESNEAGVQMEAPFNKVVFMVVDALRSDFVFGDESAMSFVQRCVIRECCFDPPKRASVCKVLDLQTDIQVV